MSDFIQKIARFGKYLIHVLISDKIPVWLTLCIAIIGGYFAYTIAPLINSQFEAQRARREFILSNLDEIATGVLTINKQSRNSESLDNNISNLFEEITKLHFSSVSLVFILPDDRNLVLSFQADLSQLQKTILQYDRDQTSFEEVQRLVRSVASSGLSINRLLLDDIGFSQN